MEFFAQANQIFSSAENRKAFALQSPNGSTHLFWGENLTEKSLSLTPHSFFKNKQAEEWDGFEKLCLDQKLSAISPPPPLTKKISSPVFSHNKSAWVSLCKKIQAGLENNEFQKIVPAKFVEANISEDEYRFVLENLFARLCHRAAPNTYKFVVRADQSYFFGATPELLFYRNKDSIFVPAIAGTRKITLNNESAKTKELFDSTKEREEHSLVVQGIVESLRTLGLKPFYPDFPEIKRFGTLLHLFTPITCANIEALSSQKLIEALHPTAAIGGSPKSVAMDFLAKNEGWNRGLFSSPLHFSLEKEELCLVAIRSSLLRPKSLRFFAGAGFVKGSDPEKEWEETEFMWNALASLFFEES